MSFLSTPLGFTREEFKTYVEKLDWSSWRPRFIVLHNTAEPNLAQWAHGANEHQRILNLNHYYKAEKGWHSGPHLFISRRASGSPAILPQTACIARAGIAIRSASKWSATTPRSRLTQEMGESA